jgi:hypothetical protein
MATERYRISERTYIASLCDLKLHDCKYSKFVPFQHYHPPTVKCQLSIDQDDRPHEHCIPQECALPDRVGGCILSTMPSLSHTYCHWNEEDRDGWAGAHRRIYDASKKQDARRGRLKMLDRRYKVQEPPWQPYFGNGI